ncbi:MAG: autotransporter outer membrane beta-barrel domain-containing protein [Myxococcales bacterium]|nr:autotransporter outer membrane beta-barrel domain-containing protein [Myxococcales bacterium]
MKRRKALFAAQSLVLVLCVVCGATSATAQSDATSIRAMGMGRAATASATGSGALFHNPAGVSALMMYSVEAAFSHDMGSGLNTLQASITDGKSNPSIGGGVGYRYATSTRNAELPSFTGHDVFGVLSAPIVPGVLLIGAGIHYIDYSQFDNELARGVTLDSGLMVNLGDFISFGAAVQNILKVDGADQNLETSFGLNYHSHIFQVSFDTQVEFADEENFVNYGVGAEFMIGQSVPIRAGYHRDARNDEQNISAGVGYRSAVIGGDILFIQDVVDTSNRLLGLALNVYL